MAMGYSTTTVTAFDPATGTISTLPGMAAPRSGHAAAVVDNKIYVYGGSGTSGEVFDWQAKVWTSLPAMPATRTSFGMRSRGGKLYIAGNSYLADASVICFDTVTKTFSTLPAMNKARASLMLEIVGDKLYAIAGVTRSGSSSVNDNAVAVFNFLTNSWANLPPGPFSGAGTSACLGPDIICVPNSGGAYRLDTTTGVWSSFPVPTNKSGGIAVLDWTLYSVTSNAMAYSRITGAAPQPKNSVHPEGTVLVSTGPAGTKTRLYQGDAARLDARVTAVHQTHAGYDVPCAWQTL